VNLSAAAHVVLAVVMHCEAVHDHGRCPGRPAYPHATFYRFSDGHLRLLIDFHVGIWVQWVPETSPGQYLVVIEIFAASASK
jgi:hypothetical protein